MKLPTKVCHTINKLNKDFIWGDTNTRKMVHLVNWRTVCKPKKYGGLGLRTSEEYNLPKNAKLGWLIINEDNPQIKAVKAKYKFGKILNFGKTKKEPHTFGKASTPLRF